MSKAKGTVTKIGDGKYSKFIMLDTREGFYFNTKYEPKVGVGDEVGIEFEPKGDSRGNIKRVVMITDNGGPKGCAASAPPAKSGGGGGKYQDQRPSIVWQHSQEMAISYVALLMSTESVKQPKAADREAAIRLLVDESTVRFNAEALAAKLSTDTPVTEDAPTEEAPTKTDEWDQSEDAPSKDEWSKDDEWSD